MAESSERMIKLNYKPAEMRILRRVKDCTARDSIQNEEIREELGI